MLNIKITDKRKCRKVSHVEISGSNYLYKNTFTGTVYIELKNKESIVSTGEHGTHDWVDEFGFIIVES